MSFILDALRKSENERREQAPPALAATLQAVPKQKRTIWLPILVIVLTVNVIVFSTIFLTRDEPQPVIAAPLTATAPEVRSLRKEVIVDAPTKRPAITPTAEIPVAAPVPSETIQERLPSLGQVKAAGLVSVTHLHIDMHVYAGDAKKRFVFINMNKYREGDQLSEGPTIEEITPEGVIMVQQGNRFRLDRD